MDNRIRELAYKTCHEVGFESPEHFVFYNSNLKEFAELIVQDYARKTIQGLMSDPAFVQAMDEYYEQKWAHRFD